MYFHGVWHGKEWKKFLLFHRKKTSQKSLNSCGVASTIDQHDIDIDIDLFDISHIQLEGLADNGFDQDYEENLLRLEFKRCSEVWGCFRLTNHGILGEYKSSLGTCLSSIERPRIKVYLAYQRQLHPRMS